MLCVIWSLFGQEWTKKAHFLSYIFSFYTFLVLALVIFNVLGVYLQIDQVSSFGDLFKDSETVLVLVITSINVLGYIVIALIHLPTHCKFVFKLAYDVFSYLAYQGAYSHVMLIYAFCNVDNVSWGTKGNKGARVFRYLIEKVNFIADWYTFCYLGSSTTLYSPSFSFTSTSSCPGKLKKVWYSWLLVSMPLPFFSLKWSSLLFTISNGFCSRSAAER